MIHRYLSGSAQQAYSELSAKLAVDQKRDLERVLLLTLYESLARTLPKNHRQNALILLKSQDPAFDTWLTDVSPHSRLTIEESLLRSLLSLRVE